MLCSEPSRASGTSSLLTKLLPANWPMGIQLLEASSGPSQPIAKPPAPAGSCLALQITSWFSPQQLSLRALYLTGIQQQHPSFDPRHCPGIGAASAVAYAPQWLQIASPTQSHTLYALTQPSPARYSAFLNKGHCLTLPISAQCIKQGPMTAGTGRPCPDADTSAGLQELHLG
jgi:hypothetical protein